MRSRGLSGVFPYFPPRIDRKIRFLSLGIVDNFITYFKVLRLEGKSFGQALTGSIGEIRKGFTGLQKTAITAVAGLVEFAVVKTVFRDLLRGTKKLGAGIAELVIAVAAAGAAILKAIQPRRGSSRLALTPALISIFSVA